MGLKLYNTLRRQIEEFQPPGETIRIYSCGLTVQGPPHIGHMRPAVFRDVLVRWLAHLGYRAMTVENFTDVDDKIIEKQKEQHRDWRMIAEDNIAIYLSACDRMNIARAGFYPRASQHIEEIITLVRDLIDKGFAYEKQGDVYFRVRSFPGYGKLSGKPVDDLVSGVRIDPSDLKDDPLDFALWKAAKPAEPFWLSPWGKGRPGWHIECSAMSMHYLGPHFDIHTGGEDLVFPHHENEIAQSEAASGQPLARYWLHSGWVLLSGQKMSKSTGHFLLIEDVLANFSANVVRLFLLKTHYRNQVEFSRARLEEARAAYNRVRNFIHGFSGAPPAGEPLKITEFTAALNDDLNTPAALAVIFELINQGYEEKNPGPEISASVRFYLGILGFAEDKPVKPLAGVMELFRNIKSRLAAGRVDGLTQIFSRRLESIADADAVFDQVVNSLLDLRNTLRAEKDFALADDIRNRLAGLDIQIFDRDAKTSIFRLEPK